MLLIIGIFVGLLGLAVLATVIYILVNRRKNLRVLVGSPGKVEVGSKFKLDLRITNPTRATETLEFLDVNKSFLDCFEMIGVLPHAQSKVEALGSTGIHYQKEIGPGQFISIEIHLRAVRPGKARGEISAINSRLLAGKGARTMVEVIPSDSS
ncbi:MAG: hypothetical protein ACE5JU_25055 [Candidatus Binatia bacterium]